MQPSFPIPRKPGGRGREEELKGAELSTFLKNFTNFDCQPHTCKNELADFVSKDQPREKTGLLRENNEINFL